ncbi:hypothetical protein [Flavobacterium geliluteum]|uniref:Uncharacterized protein n=1 Tax=Flavobacterium geliluteum TaxID=2816120 RepID=A0A941B1Z4_9FLAO|nr:hypothetical protein [Flavobacterium geliluteum]MBP4136948.1 hypothetical protein [Flavobacterium geliluteum]
MATMIKYTNTDFEEITQQQVSKSKEYHKETYENGELKLIQKYWMKGRNVETSYNGGEYYLSLDENLEDIINQYLPIGISWFFYYNKVTNANNDEKWEYQFFHKGILDRKGVEVYNKNGELLASCIKDLLTNDIKEKRKYFYGDLNIFKRIDYKYPYYTFNYEDNGIDTIFVHDEDYRLNEFLASNEMSIFPWNDHSYYHDFEPLLPTGLNI